MDESFQEHDDAGFYIVAAALVNADVQERARAEMRELQRRHAPAKLHWAKRDARERLVLSEAVAGLDLTHVVVVGSPVGHRRQERARARCLGLLVCALHAHGVEHLFAEARQAALNARDVTTVQQARYSLPRDARLRLDHVHGAAEPLLWIADIVAGAMRADRLGDGRYRAILGPRIRELAVATD